MQLLRFNGQDVDTDDETAIGITLQAYDIKTLTPQKVSYSNTFSIPKTSQNNRILGWAGNPESKSLLCYGAISVDYWLGNYQIIKQGTARITAIKDRIELFITSKSDVWDQMKEVSWPSFQSDFLTWLDLPTEADPYVGNYADFITYLLTTDLLLPAYYGNLLKYDTGGGGGYAEDGTKIALRYDSFNGGHFSATYKKVFEYLEQSLGVNFGASETFDYNLFNDTYAAAVFTPLKNITINNLGTGWFVEYTELAFEPHKITQAQADKTLYDCVKSWLVYFNALIDYNIQEDRYYLRRFDDVKNAAVKEITTLTGTPEFYPTQEGLKQNNYITLAKTYKGGSLLTNYKKIVCENKNLLKGTPAEALFTIDAYANAVIPVGPVTLPDLSVEEAFETFSLLITDTDTISLDITTRVGGVDYTTTQVLSVAKMYGLSNEFLGLDTILEYPATYKIKKWLTIYEIVNFEFFKRYWIPELNGYFFVNKIAGYNPNKSKEPTAIEIVKIQ